MPSESHKDLIPGDPELVSDIVDRLKKEGLFDQFRKDFFSDIDTKPAFQHLRSKVVNYVSLFLDKYKWKPDLNKNQIRDNLRRHVNQWHMLSSGMDRIVEQVIDPQINQVLRPEVAKFVYDYLGVEPVKQTDQKSFSYGVPQPYFPYGFHGMYRSGLFSDNKVETSQPYTLLADPLVCSSSVEPSNPSSIEYTMPDCIPSTFTSGMQKMESATFMENSALVDSTTSFLEVDLCCQSIAQQERCAAWVTDEDLQSKETTKNIYSSFIRNTPVGIYFPDPRLCVDIESDNDDEVTSDSSSSDENVSNVGVSTSTARYELQFRASPSGIYRWKLMLQ